MLKDASGFMRWLLLPRRERREPRFAAHRYARQRRLGFPMLRFFPELEKEYRESFITVNVMRIRVAHSTGLIGMSGFIIMDRWIGMDLQPLSAVAVLLLICFPAMIVPMMATFLPSLHRYLQHFIYTGTLLLGFGVVGVIYLGRLAHADFPYESVILVTIYVYYVSGLLWIQALTCGWLIWGGFILMSSAGFGPAPMLLYEAYYLALANLIGMIGRYIFEYQDRLAFLMQRELRYLAQHDSLTGLLNRRAFRRQADALWAQAAREGCSIGLLLLDLDHFKKINDRYGHLVGDAALRLTAQTLREFAKRPLDCAGRFGGDEFVAIWYDVEPAWFEQMQNLLCARLTSRAIEHSLTTLRLQLSGGAIVAWPQKNSRFQESLHAADANLYEMKRMGHSRILCTQADKPQSAGQRLTLISSHD